MKRRRKEERQGRDTDKRESPKSEQLRVRGERRGYAL